MLALLFSTVVLNASVPSPFTFCDLIQLRHFPSEFGPIVSLSSDTYVSPTPPSLCCCPGCPYMSSLHLHLAKVMDSFTKSRCGTGLGNLSLHPNSSSCVTFDKYPSLSEPSVPLSVKCRYQFLMLAVVKSK